MENIFNRQFHLVKAMDIGTRMWVRLPACLKTAGRPTCSCGCLRGVHACNVDLKSDLVL